ncbi:MAG: hypothetical protein WAV16_02375 [Candidatus Moraniibacteriota bacterium]
MLRIGKNQKKIMLILLGGLALGLSNSPRKYFDTFNKIKKDWNDIDRRTFNHSCKRLSQEKLIEERKMPDGSFKLVLTKKGKVAASELSLIGSAINFKKPEKWDKRWRIVIFDIPEKDRMFRDILRQHLYALNFFKIQQSVLVSPYPYEEAILELVSLYSAERYVRVITAISIDNEKRLKAHFFKK